MTINQDNSIKTKITDKIQAHKEIVIVALVICIFCILSIIIFVLIPFIPSGNYNKATLLFDNGNYEEAADIFKQLGNYKDSPDKYNESVYKYAENLFDNKKYFDAALKFNVLGDYKNSYEMYCESSYQNAVQYFEKGDYYSAKGIFRGFSDYKDSKERITECDYMLAINDFENKQSGDDYSTLIWKFQELGDYKDSVEMAEKCKELQKEYENKQQEQQSDAKPETESKGEDEWTLVFRKACQYSADYYKAVIDDVRVNEDFGTSASGDYIASVYVTWNEKNSGKTSKEMLDLYSSDMAARMYDDLPEIQELVVYWTVPYLNNGSAKISFERTSSGMKYTDKIFDSNFD